MNKSSFTVQLSNLIEVWCILAYCKSTGIVWRLGLRLRPWRTPIASRPE